MATHEELIRDGYDFDFSGYLNRGWELTKSTLGQLIGILILSIVISLVLQVVPFIGWVASNLVSPILSAGVFYFLYQYKSHNDGNFNHMFAGFSFAGPIILSRLVIFLFYLPFIIVMFAAVIPFELFAEMIAGGQPNPQVLTGFIEGRIAIFALTMLAFLVLSMYIYASYSFVYPLILIEKKGFWDAMETSRKVVAKNFFSYVGLFIVLFFINVLGALVCGIGLLLTVPYSICVIYCAYDGIFQPQQDTMEDKIDQFGVQDHDMNTESEEDDRLDKE